MQRSRIGILGSSLAVGLAGMFAAGGSDVVTIERERPISAKRRRVAPTWSANGRSKYTPHIGAKEQERAKRCRMSGSLNKPNGLVDRNPRCARTMQQMSKKQYAATHRA